MIQVLLVDDDPGYARLVAIALEELADVVRGATLAEGLALARANPPEVVLCDLHLPDATGATAIAAMAAALPDTAVIALSGADGPAAVTALEAGAHDFELKGGEVDGRLAAAVASAARCTGDLRRSRRAAGHEHLVPGAGDAAPTAPRGEDGEDVEPDGDIAVAQALAAHTPVGLFRTDASGTCTWTNARFRQLSGLSAEAARGSGWITAVHLADRAAAISRWRRATAHGREFAMELRFRRPDGSVVEAHVTAAPVGGAGIAAGPAAWVGVVVDETARRAAERELAASRAQLAAFIGASPSAIYLKDLEDRVVLTNPAAAEVFTRPPAELEGQCCTELLGVPDLDVHRLDRAVLRSGAARQDELVLPHADGTQHTWLTVRFPVRDTDRIITGIGVVATDLTERLRLEHEVERQRRLLEQAQEVAGIAVWSWDPDRTQVVASPQLIELLGLPGEATDEPWKMLPRTVSATDFDRLRTLFARSREHPGEYALRFRCEPQAGRPRMIQTRWRSERHDGAITIVGATQDVTAEHEREQALLAAETQLRMAFETAPIGIGIADAAGRWVRVNPAIASLLGRRPGELLGTALDTVIHPADRDFDAERLAMLRRGELDVYETEKRCLRSDGQPLRIVFSISAVRVDDRAPDHLLVQLLDVTARRDLESRMRALAVTDPLTGLPDQRSFDVHLGHAAARVHRAGERVTLVLARLRRPEGGHDRRDQLTRDVERRAAARALERRLRETDVVARLGPDTFGVLLTGVEEAAAPALAGELAQAMTAAMPAGSPAEVVLGVARVGAAEDAPRRALQAAEQALAQAGAGVPAEEAGAAAPEGAALRRPPA